MNRATIIGALIIAAALAGYAKGGADNEARHTAAQLAEAKASADALARLAVVEQKNQMLAQALEDAEYAEPPAFDCGLPHSRVMRLRER